MGFLATLILGIPGIVGKLFDYLGKRSDNAVLTNGQNVTGDTTVAQAQLTAYVEERKIIAQERASQHLSPWTAWMIPAAFSFCLFHFGAIVLDSTCHFNWQVARLPGIYENMEWSIVGSVIGINGIMPTVRKIFGK